MASTVQELMSADPIVVDADTPIAECARTMERENVGSIGVARDGQLCGIVTDRDIVIRAVARDRDPCAIPAGELASSGPVTCTPETSLDDAERLMSREQVRRVFVVSDDQPVGIISSDDIAAERRPHAVEAQQIGQEGVIRSDQGHTGQFE